MTIALYFGSFNPIHIGHLIIANEIVKQTNIDKVWFVITPKSPFKKKPNLLHEFDRFQLIRLAIANNSNFNVTDIEFNLPQPNYTINTLKKISQKYPNHHFKVVMGSDNLKNFHKWKNYIEILTYYGILVYPRIGFDNHMSYKSHENVQILDVPTMNISASFIRSCIKKKQSIKYLVPLDVENYIKIKKLYL